MSIYGFDRVIDRKGTDSLKYDFAKEHSVPEDALPLWVADMDFQVAPEITERIKRIADHAIYGYTDAKDDYYEAVANWYEQRFAYRPDKRWIIKTPGVVFALAIAVNAYTSPGENILIQQPVYHPFRMVIEENARCVINSPLRYEDGRYTMDFADLEEKIERNHVKMMILCSPHNPVGRVWTKEELCRLEEICMAHQVIVVCDEIHSDFAWEGHTHHLLLALDERYAQNTIVCTAPSKTFNIAGLQCSNIFIPDPQLRRRFISMQNATGYELLNTFALAAGRAAYEEGGPWLEEAKRYIYDNILYMEKFIKESIPKIRMIRPEGTYLVWLDCSGLSMSAAKRKEFLQTKAKVWFSEGLVFGPEGEDFERVNAACPRSVLEKALTQLKEAVDALD